MKILLVLPAIEKYRITAGSGKVPGRKMLRFSIMPLTAVASLTPPEHPVAICDENVQALDYDTDADLVGVSFMSALAPRAYEIAAEFRKRGKIVVAGGYHPTLCPDETSRHFDAVVAGDAEGLWPEVLRDATEGRLKRIYRSDRFCDLSEARVPRRDLMKETSKHYATCYAVQTSRGCAHNCRYCSITAFHRGTFRTRPVESVIGELKSIPRDFIFVDDNIIADADYAKKLFSAMAPLKKRWVGQCSLRIADDPELLALARRAGCHGLFIGIETANAKNLQSVNKPVNLEDSVESRVRKIRGAGIGIIAGIIVGMDFDDTTVFESTLAHLATMEIDAVQVNIMTPLPGTPLHADMVRQGRIIDHDLANYDFRHVVFQPREMSPEQLQAGADWLYRSFYRLDRILARSIKTVFTLGPAQAYLALRLNLTYRYDNMREKIRGRNVALDRARGSGDFTPVIPDRSLFGREPVKIPDPGMNS
ncbi:MAG TPA: radical SAM protein [Spirochaetota bacterium]|nr:radical SAM protein [Spirochaetota bacterium]